MKLFIGIGNPDEKYHGTYHNLGKLVIDQVLSEQGHIKLQHHQKLHSDIVTLSGTAQKIILAKSLTYMNESGQAVRSIMDYYQLAPEDICVIHDEIALPLDTVRISFSSAPAGHNGIKDIIAHLKTKDFFRIRIGIDSPDRKIPMRDYVLSHFRTEDLQDAISNVAHKIIDIIDGNTRLETSTFYTKP